MPASKVKNVNNFILSNEVVKQLNLTALSKNKLFSLKPEEKIPEIISVQELGKRMAEKSSDIIKALMKNGVMATINQNIDADTAEIIAEEFGHKVKK